jgi:hypothetical protein
MEDLELAAEVHVNASLSRAAETHENTCLGAMLKQAGMPWTCVCE